MPLQFTPQKQIIYPGNTNLINVTDLYDSNTGQFLNAATLSATLYDDQGNVVAGCDGVVLTYVPGSNGQYKGTFGDNTFNPPPGTGYLLVISGSEAGGYVEIQITIEVKPRTR
jgi:hypothetical protein